jgi:ribosome-binding factor A
MNQSASRRQLRVAEVIRREVVNLLQRKYFCDDNNFTISRVQVSGDLKIANIFISKAEPNLFEQINKILPAIRMQLAKILHLRSVPRIKLIMDNDFDYAQKILDKLL